MTTEECAPYLSIIIPAFNEGRRLLATLETVDAFLGRQPYAAEVLVVNDCSSDDTGGVVRRMREGKIHLRLIEHPENRGKGAAVKTGVEAARGEFVLFSDADLSTPIEEVNNLMKWARGGNDGHGAVVPGGFDVVMASRRLKGARLEKRQPIYREGSGRVFSIFVRLFVFGGFRDTQCGFKLFTREAAKAIFARQTIPGFGFDVEILFIALKKLGLKVKETPVVWRDHPDTRVHLLKDSLRMFTDLFLIRWRDGRGRYR